MFSRPILTLLVALAVGCAASTESPEKNQEDLFPAADSANLTEDTSPREMVMGDSYSIHDISGSWAQLQVVATIADAPLIGQVDTLAIAWVRWEITQLADGNLTVEQDACDLALTSDNEFVQMLIPQPFVDSIVTYEKSGTIDLSVEPPEFLLPLHAEVHGAILDDDLNDLMPTTANDQRIIDGDKDGQPGLTVYVSGIVDGAIYVVQRNITSIPGIVTAPDRMEGLLGFSQEQIVMGSDNPILKDNPPVSSVNPDPEKSYFITVRIPADWSCDEIVANRLKLFGEEGL